MAQGRLVLGTETCDGKRKGNNAEDEWVGRVNGVESGEETNILKIRDSKKMSRQKKASIDD